MQKYFKKIKKKNNLLARYISFTILNMTKDYKIYFNAISKHIKVIYMIYMFNYTVKHAPRFGTYLNKKIVS